MFAEDADGVEKRNPGPILVLLGALLIGGYFAVQYAPQWVAGVTQGVPALGIDSTLLQKLLGGAVVIAALVANCYLLLRLSLRLQITVVWCELALLVVLFFSTFNLSFEFIERKIGYLILQGATTTLYISAISIALAFVLALIGALAKLSSNGIAIGIATFYTSLFRGLPLLMQIFILYLGLPQLGYIVNPIPAGVAALSLCYGAYMTEIFRAGIQSIPKGQWDAARALGLSHSMMMRLVILPQALRVIIPPTGNQFIAMLKDSSLVSVVGVWELTYVATTEGQREFRHMEMLISASVIYWLLSMVLEVIQSRIERRFRKSTR
ncbi:amino acid ABC transporter permease [Paraburkholderia susongensis]|uniref:Glutamate/aspartate import permease protein GltK n=1 Tax=Paraburkholderia susongensis TaxID=1515439 RepID=A0A1X7LRH3_9BURK|nr:amino acid ABC transporter permease [Paraburkholderia susongensis]SMG55729.1 amino acid ABC transporter membrane protein, PAAT family [Paraburkholderia susongensis]